MGRRKGLVKASVLLLSQGCSKSESAEVFRRVGKDPVGEEPLSILLCMHHSRRGGFARRSLRLQVFWSHPKHPIPQPGTHFLHFTCQIVSRDRQSARASRRGLISRVPFQLVGNDPRRVDTHQHLSCSVMGLWCFFVDERI